MGAAAAAGRVGGRVRAAAQVTPAEETPSEEARNPCMPLILDISI
jgi:hypothetical protein